jgi:CHAD domain-containing protein
MRRLRSTVLGFSSALALPKAAREKNIGKVARVLGTLRDLDVLEEALKYQYQPLLPNQEQKYLTQALDILEKQRKEAFKKVKFILHDDFYRNLKQAFQTWLEEPQYQQTAHFFIEDILPDLLLPQMSKFSLHPGWLTGVKLEFGQVSIVDDYSQEAVEKLLHQKGAMLHDLRKEAKRTRYQMELFTNLYGEIYQNFVKDIKAIQTILGEIQDGFVLAEFLSSIFAADITHQMPTLVDQLTATRYQKWQDWIVLQHKFLNPQIRRELHMTIQQPDTHSINSYYA